MSEDPFVVAVDRFIKRAKDKAELALQATAQDALARVKELTPVDTGTLRAAWTVVRGSAATTLTGVRAEDSLSVLATLKLGDTVTLLNEKAYARRIEFGYVGTDKLGRYYDQKGKGMMTQTIAELPKIARAAAERVKAQ